MIVLIRRVGFYVITAFIAITLDFFLPHMMPGNPVEVVFNSQQGKIPPEAVDSLYAQFGLDSKESLWGQYLDFWNHLFHGNLGLSISHYPEKVSTVIGQSVYWTLLLVGVATVISFVIGTTVGTLAGWRRGGLLDGVLPVATFFQAMPYFFLGTLLVLFFAQDLPVFPVQGGYDFVAHTPGFNSPFIGDALYHATLPALTIVLASLAGWIIGMRNMMITVRDEDYVLLAEAEMLSRRRVVWYAVRNAILPQVSSFALALSFVVTGSLLTEIVFNYPGVGLLLQNAVTAEDYPLIQGIFLIITLVVLLANFLADIAYAALDPRARQEA